MWIQWLKDYLSGMNVLNAGIPDSSKRSSKNAILLQIGKEEENMADTL